VHAQTLTIPIPFDAGSDTTTHFSYSILGGIGGPTTTIALEVAVTDVQGVFRYMRIVILKLTNYLLRTELLDTLIATYALASDHLDFTNTVVISGSPGGAASGECNYLFALAQTTVFAMSCSEMDGTDSDAYTAAITTLVLNAQAASSSL
jgi:hypothetical protein